MATAKEGRGLFGKRKKAASQAKSQAVGARRSDYSVLQSPVITEKSARSGSEGNSVVFHVAREASKTDIREAVERIYKVQVRGVRTVNYMGKVKRARTSLGRRAAFKKAYVSLKEGQSIDVVEGL